MEVKPAARRICRIGGRRRDGWRGLVDIDGDIVVALSECKSYY